MASEAPPFWWGKPDWRSFALAPFAAIYGAVARRRLIKTKPPKIALPVLCIGNFTVGGAGKTPTAIAFAKTLTARGFKPGIVSRGYGGSYAHMHLVDEKRDSAQRSGDEPLLLARHASVVVSADRLAAARFLASQGCDFILMDDGFQSARLYADFALLVVDAARGIGNGRVIPAGPLRAPLSDQMHKTDALLRIGKGDAADSVIRQAARAAKPVYDAHLQPSCATRVAEKRWLAFAGIGNPDKFFDSVREMGGDVVEGRPFGDHYAYTTEDAQALLQAAQNADLGLITTAKDHVRLSTTPDMPNDFMKALVVLDVELVFDRHKATDQIIDTVVERFNARR